MSIKAFLEKLSVKPEKIKEEEPEVTPIINRGQVKLLIQKQKFNVIFEGLEEPQTILVNENGVVKDIFA